MIVFLSELQKGHLKILHEHSLQVLVDFCKLTIDFLTNGTNIAKCNVAAEKLQVSAQIVENVLKALVYLLVEGCKYSLSEADFKSSLALAGFSADQQAVLLRLYNTKSSEISEALCLLQQKDLVYQDLLWRFEVQLASRNSPEEITPMVFIDLVFTSPKNYGQIQEENIDTVSEADNQHFLSIKIKSPIKDAKAANQCQNLIHNVFLQCDLPNLLHITNKLEQALKESKSQHVRKVQRALR